ncbi:alpha/beta hydrolase family protein [Halogeometricum borinquense]|uniref:Alpha/beta hydrolase family protein n=1 Tax=Halogeometricum borinquense TaxID=60847 RepID=A0A6C0UJ89_9EURY|nr:alpha/beta hydrolase family protein [Halogeometricum borinquense]QIB74653.1 alpha/beta hydrolase family protein [Halogeometricum borinquense]QIQ76394.1 alpha/beta hydrolase family protein [Halogeometricum borinquense]
MDRLDTSRVHRLLESPVGGLFETAPLETLQLRRLPRQFAVRRARAAADVSLGAGPAAFLREADAPPAPHLHDRIEAALAEFAEIRERHEEVSERWEAAFWGDEETTPNERVALERERRRADAAHARPSSTFGFLASDHFVPPVAFDVPSPDDARERWAHELAEPERLYGFADSTVTESLPRVSRSKTVLGPGTVEYRLRFETPSLHVGDTATARVYEPDGAADDIPTLVFFSGLGSYGDRLSYWPEEEAIGRRLARDGYRAVLPDAPWHGRREPLGQFSGEPYLARMPVSAFELLGAAVQETGVLVDWARTEGAPAVAVGGLSLGGSIAFAVAGRCGEWPEPMRPDLVGTVAAPGSLMQTLSESKLVSLLDLDDALSAAGWTDEDLNEFAPLLDPPAEPDLAPERIFCWYGSHDDVAPTETTATLVRQWDVPRRNVRTWDRGHLGTAARLYRGDEFQRTLTAALDRLAATGRDDDESDATAETTT